MSARGDGFGVALLLLVVAAHAPPGAAQPCFSNIKGQGVIATPNFYATSYPGANPVSGGGRCQWTLTPAAGKQGNILFNVFDLAPGATLSIYQGTNTGVTPLTRYTGKGPKGGVIQISGVVTLVFVDADLSLNKGFQLAFYSTAPPLPAQPRLLKDVPSPECGETLVSAGIVKSPGQPGFYPLNSRCRWTLMPCEPGAQIEVHFTYMDLETDADRVRLFSGLIEKGPYSGNALPVDFTATGPITVTFESDNVGSSNTGFVLEFRTVSTQGTPSDPLANPGACDALCPANKTEDPSSHCYAHDDPHILRFDSVAFSLKDDFQKAGVYYLYKHKTAPVSVQAAFQPCIKWPNAFCVCAVAVRYCDEVFVVDRCNTKTPPGQSDKLYRAGSSYSMNILPRPTGRGWTVRLPTGLRVEIDSTTQWIGNVDLYDSLVNKHASEGICRDVYRCGTSKAQYERSYDSWWVPAQESSFTNWKQTDPLKPRSTCKISKCGGCSRLTQYPVPNKVVDMEKVNAQYSDSNNFLHGSPGPRGNTGAIGAEGDRGPAPRFVAPWTAQRAFWFCYNALQNTPAMKECNRQLRRPVNLDNDIATCIGDIQITGTTDFLITAKEASITTCLQSLKNAGVDPRSVLDLTCPNDCSGNGVCNKGVCSCFPGRYDTDCSLTIPKLDNTRAEVNCPANATVSGVCLLQYVFGGTFTELRSRIPSCKIAYQAVNTGGLPTTFNLTVVPATYFNATTVLCQLPPGKPGERVTYSISISNDGASYSNNVTTQRTFVPVCGQTFYGSGTLRSPNYPLDYPSSTLCIWDLIATNGRSVQLTFGAFHLELSFDVLRCYDKGQLIDSFTGNLNSDLPTKYYGSTLRCEFRSDQIRTASGFSIAFNSYLPGASCGGSVSGTATINSPGYPTPGYPNNIYCLWTLTATPGKVLKLHFDDFALEDNFDFLRVFTGGSLYASATGLTPPTDYTLQSTAYLVLRSDEAETAKGFSIRMTSV